MVCPCACYCIFVSRPQSAIGHRYRQHCAQCKAPVFNLLGTILGFFALQERHVAPIGGEIRHTPPCQISQYYVCGLFRDSQSIGSRPRPIKFSRLTMAQNNSKQYKVSTNGDLTVRDARIILGGHSSRSC